MPTRPLPNDPSLEHLRKQAKRLVNGVRAADADALGQVKEFHPRPASAIARFSLADAQLVTARTYGFGTWTKLLPHAELLVEHGVDVNAPGLRTGRTPYETRCDGNDDIAAYLVEHGAKKVELNAVDRFTLACIAGRREEVRAQLAEDPALIDKLGHFGRVDLIHRAVEANAREGIRLIAELGIDINGLVPNTGVSASVLHSSAMAGNLEEMVRLLVARGADINARAKDGRTLLDRALARGETDFANVSAPTAPEHPLAKRPRRNESCGRRPPVQ
jgi:ankyrin repeat protein